MKWWRVAFYPWGYPTNPDKKPDSALCPLCGPLVNIRWEPGLAVVPYGADDVKPGETCIRCGMICPHGPVVGECLSTS